jgi:hypothetical protein
MPVSWSEPPGAAIDTPARPKARQRRGAERFFAAGFVAVFFAAGLVAVFFAELFFVVRFFAAGRCAVFSAAVNAASLGAPALPGARMCSPLPCAMRSCLAWMFAYRPGLELFLTVGMGVGAAAVRYAGTLKTWRR